MLTAAATEKYQRYLDQNAMRLDMHRRAKDSLEACYELAIPVYQAFIAQFCTPDTHEKKVVGEIMVEKAAQSRENRIESNTIEPRLAMRKKLEMINTVCIMNAEFAELVRPELEFIYCVLEENNFSHATLHLLGETVADSA